MKKINKLGLNYLSKVEMGKREMNTLKGGCMCVCSCTSNGSCTCSYADEQCPSGDDKYGGSSTYWNDWGNAGEVNKTPLHAMEGVAL